MSTKFDIHIQIPTPLRSFTNNLKSVVVKGNKVSEVLEDLITLYPKLKLHLYDDRGELRNFVNVYLNDEDIRYLDKGNSVLHDGDVLAIVPSIAGGTT